VVSPGSTNPAVTEKGDYIFRVCFIDPLQGTVMAKFALDNVHAKKIAIFQDVKSDYLDHQRLSMRRFSVALSG
jgi:branched-chain amino acid transport system substrate-binding protein